MERSVGEFGGKENIQAYLERGITLGKTLEKVGTIITKDAVPLGSEGTARVENDDDGWYRRWVLKGQRTCHERSNGERRGTKVFHGEIKSSRDCGTRGV
jgi:hypothetical protein